MTSKQDDDAGQALADQLNDIMIRQETETFQRLIAEGNEPRMARLMAIEAGKAAALGRLRTSG